jgi:uncharacterized protein YjdB
VVTTQLIGTSGSSTLTAIVIDPDQPAVPLGAVKPFTLTATDSTGGTLNVAHLAAWSVDTPAVATVDGGGRLTALAQGTTTLTATLGELTATTTVTVSGPAEISLRVTPDAATLDSGASFQLTAFMLMTDGTWNDLTTVVTWNSAAPGVATVDSGGVVTGVSAGAATITATTGDHTATVTLQVVETVPTTTFVVLTPPTATVQVGQTVQLSATAGLSDQTATNVTATASWTVDPAGVASVSGGVVTALAEGTTTIRATAGGATGTATVQVIAVQPLVLGVAVIPGSRLIPKGASYTFSLLAIYGDGTVGALTSEVTWETVESAVATVDSDGRVVAVDLGETTLTATWGAMSATATVGVTTPVGQYASLAIDPSEVSVIVGETTVLRAIGTREDGSTVVASEQATWSSLDEAVATVSQLGVVTSVSGGTVIIRAVVGGLIADATVVVRAPTPAPVLVSSRQVVTRVPVRYPTGVPTPRPLVTSNKPVRAYVPIRFPSGAPTPSQVQGVHTSAKPVRAFVPVPDNVFDPSLHKGVLSSGTEVGVEWLE